MVNPIVSKSPTLFVRHMQVEAVGEVGTSANCALTQFVQMTGMADVAAALGGS